MRSSPDWERVCGLTPGETDPAGPEGHRPAAAPEYRRAFQAVFYRYGGNLRLDDRDRRAEAVHGGLRPCWRLPVRGIGLLYLAVNVSGNAVYRFRRACPGGGDAHLVDPLRRLEALFTELKPATPMFSSTMNKEALWEDNLRNGDPSQGIQGTVVTAEFLKCLEKPPAPGA